MNTRLASQYSERYEHTLRPLAIRLQKYLATRVLKGITYIDRVTVRPKAVDRFLKKAAKLERGKPKYKTPLSDIQDQIGARIVVRYVEQVQSVGQVVIDHLNAIEEQDIVPDSEAEFGYVGKHYVAVVPVDVIPKGVSRSDVPPVFELQIKTLFQHAWSEANHDLAYKPDKPLSSDQKRRIAFTAAQAWGADQIFQDLYQVLNPTPDSSATDGK